MSEEKKLTIDKVFGKDGLFSEKIPHYEIREGQMQMARGVLDSFKNPSLFIVEAGTGTGKTYSYLVPALLSNKQVLISTATKALQDQIIKNDVPKLTELLGIDCNYMVLKGFSNYLCRHKYEEEKRGNYLSPKQKDNIDELILEEEHKIEIGSNSANFMDISNISILSRDSARFTVNNKKECLKRKCPYLKKKDSSSCKCFPILAREKAMQCNIIIVNHALYFADLGTNNNKQILPIVDAYVFDESHSIPDVARNFLSRNFEGKEVLKELASIFDEIPQNDEALKTLRPTLMDKMTELSHAIGEMNSFLQDHEVLKNNNRVNFLDFKYEKDSNNTKINKDFQEKFANIFKALKDLWKYCEENKDFLIAIEKEAIPLIHDYIDTLQYIGQVDKNNKIEKNQHVAYIELLDNSFNFVLTPLDVGHLIGNTFKQYIEDKKGIVCTSATITVKDDFSKYENDIGANLLPKARNKNAIVPSVFDYKKNSRIYVSSDFPDVKDNTRIITIIKMLKDTIDSVKGGIFFLTTSNQALDIAYKELSQLYKGKRLVLAQNQGRSNAFILDEFKKDGKAILIGTSSFWEGVDVPGSALSLVIIDKIPFSSPSDPLFKARCENLEEKGLSSFFNISIPEAVIALRQGVGRLIRQEKDRGAMIICDPRLVHMKYGAIFMNSLPPMQKCKSLTEVISFLKEK